MLHRPDNGKPAERPVLKSSCIASMIQHDHYGDLYTISKNQAILLQHL